MDQISNISKANYIIFCLPTPLINNSVPDMSLVKDAFRVKKFLKKGQTIILESTVYPGATKEIFFLFI